MSWRDAARPVIARVLAETKGKTEPEIRAALHDAYPFGMRAHHPYKIWCDEIQRQMGRKPPLGSRRRSTRPGVEIALPLFD